MSTTTLRFARTVAILVAVLPLILFAFRPAARAVESTDGHHNGFNRVTGTLSAANSSDGRWFFISGQKVRFTAVAQSTNGGVIGSLLVYSQRQGWLQTSSSPSTQQQFQRDLPGGWHYFRLTANGASTTTYTLTLTSSELTPDAGGTVATARNLGLVGEVNQAGRVSSNDADVYSFVTANPGPGYGLKFISVSAFKANGNGATIDLARVVNGVETLVASGITATDSQSPVLSKSVPTGAYILRVRQGSGQQGTGYQLFASIEDARADFGGDPGAMVPPRSRPLADFLDSRKDPVDMYVWTMPQPGTVSINVRENTGDANLTLLNGQGTVIARSQVANSTSENISVFLAIGEYRLIIGAVREGETAYLFTFGITFPPAPAGPLDAPGNRFQPAILQPSNQFVYNRSETIGGVIGPTPDTEDWYTLTIPSSATVRPNDLRAFNLTVSGLPIGATVTVIHERTNRTADSRTINQAGSVTYGVSLAGGESNLVQVSVPTGTPIAPYTLSLACVGGAPCNQ
jgi:hypothetical protein